MRQAIETGKFSPCTPRSPSWHARLRDWLFGRPAGGKLIRWDQRSAHMLRDIGLMEDGRDNELMRDRAVTRR
jgi:hypothetical protein